ncbi:hypothetical protein ACIGHC_12165, partial [Staphylococcus saprophyticus]|uniref:hypothetical protein n=2 Tax=Staphylococcus saprophyticus TaxID=29385 RepID=UPI0037D3BEC1
MKKIYISIIEYIGSITGFNFVFLLAGGNLLIGMQAIKRFVIQWFFMVVSFVIINVSMSYISIIFNHLPINMWTIILMWQYVFSYFTLSYGVPLVISRICNKKMMNSLIKYYEEKRAR